MLNIQQYKEEILLPVLDLLESNTPSALQLMLGTMAQESRCGTYISQLKDGPARGIYQMEEATYQDILDNFIKYRLSLSHKILFFLGYNEWPEAKRLNSDLLLSTIFARLHYKRVPEELPVPNDVRAMAKYYKKYYNTPKGKATEEEFIKNYEKYIANCWE